MTKTEQVYGGSLYDLAREEGLTAEIGEELRQIIALFDGEPDYWRFLSTLSISKDERCKALDEAFKGRIQPYLLNFLKILCENGTMGSLKGCAQEYRRRFNEEGIASKMILQVHDEVIIDTLNSEVDKVREIVCSSMESVADLAVPLTAEAGTGKNWLEAH